MICKECGKVKAFFGRCIYCGRKPKRYKPTRRRKTYKMTDKKEIIEKGCGKVIKGYFRNPDWKCGDISKVKKRVLLCPKCLRKLTK